jgi:hypothetical protein
MFRDDGTKGGKQAAEIERGALRLVTVSRLELP